MPLTMIKESPENDGLISDRFRCKFKYYKAKKPKPSLCEVVDLACNTKNVVVHNIDANPDIRTDYLGLKPTTSWVVHDLPKHPGLLLISNPFTSLGQRYWIRRCIEGYPRIPNKTNIDVEYEIDGWWRDCYRNGKCDLELLKKLRWTTLGYHHNWDTKVYSEDNKSPFPDDLAELCDVVAQCIGCINFRAEAAIVNYYHMDSTLSPHTDHSEVNLDAPLFSFSFGQSAIFLCGGRDKTVEPTAIKLNSGDIVIMSKEARLSYHAVPKILEAPKSVWNEELTKIEQTTNRFKWTYILKTDNIVDDMNNNLDNEQWNEFCKYVSKSRINMNVRQVLGDTQTNLLQSHFKNT